jgi:hypothetical protein
MTLVVLGVAGRLLPHAPNFTPVAACALFAGFLFGRRAAFAVPLVIMLAGDALIGFYDYRIMAAVYAATAFPVLLGPLVRSRLPVLWLGAFSLLSSVIFFLSSNLAVWAFGSIYERTWSGLLQCYTAALPFFRYTVAGDLVWSAGLFGAYAVACQCRALWQGRLARGRVAWIS